MDAPRYQDLRDARMPRVALAGDAGVVRVIAGAFGGQRGPAHTVTPIELWDVTLAPHGELPIELPADHTKMVLVRSGDAVLDERHALASNELAQWPRGTGKPRLRAGAQGCQLLFLGGAPIDEPVVGYGPFVMNTRAEIAQAVDDFHAGRMGAL
jgi:hypothetical protein